MAVLTKRAVCNYSACSHLVTLQNKCVINAATQNCCRNEWIAYLYLSESGSYNRYCLKRIYPKLVLWGLFPSLTLNDTHPAAEVTTGPFIAIEASALQVSFPLLVNWVVDRGPWGQLLLAVPMGWRAHHQWHQGPPMPWGSGGKNWEVLKQQPEDVSAATVHVEDLWPPQCSGDWEHEGAATLFPTVSPVLPHSLCDGAAPPP